MSHDPANAEPTWVHGHRHDPNPQPPPGDATIHFVAGAQTQLITAAFLGALPHIEVADCFIVSTGHGRSGPFTFGGVTLRDLLAKLLPAGLAWRHVDVVSGDGFGARLTPAEVLAPADGRPVLMADTLDGAPLTRAAGLVRLIVPGEIDDALKQVKWIARIEVA
jgi:DMSO/TMAO reductase YedYZ molybdopterin-dependent catalytic subunit